MPAASAYSASENRRASSSAACLVLLSVQIRDFSQRLGMVTMLSVLATHFLGSPSRLDSGTSVGIPRSVVEISTTESDVRTA